MNLRHYCHEPVDFNRDLSYIQCEPMEGYKPNGFWVSVVGENDWLDWCTSQMGWHAAVAHAYRVELAPDVNLLRLQTATEVTAFHEEYSVELDFAIPNDAFQRSLQPVDWRRVAQEYDGIIIAPYQRSLRLRGPQWYNSWDCASGCLFSTAAIDSVTLVARAAPYEAL